MAPILQLAVSLDYAIFLLHRFNEYRTTHEPAEAMRRALQRALPTVAASAATTVIGFSALLFMRFGVGPDLGIHLAKGVLLSFLSVMIFLPALTLTCYRAIDKTRHKNLREIYHEKVSGAPTGLNAYLDGVDGLAAGYSELHEGAELLVHGIGRLKAGAENVANGTGELNDAVTDLPDTMRREGDTLVGRYDKSDFSPVSFASEKNTNETAV